MKAHQSVEQVEFDYELGELDICIAFTRTTTYHRENYGADADGNRGMMMDMIDSDDASNVRVLCEDTRIADGWVTATALPPWLQTPVNQAVEKYLADHDPEPEDEQEPDYDDYGD